MGGSRANRSSCRPDLGTRGRTAEAEYGTTVDGGPIVAYGDALCVHDMTGAERLMEIANDLHLSPHAAVLGAFEPRAGLLCLPILSTHGYEVIKREAQAMSGFTHNSAGHFHHMAGENDESVRDEFRDAVNMSAKQIEDWLGTKESKGVGQKSDGHESTGHASGRRIVEILRTKKADLSDADVDHMRKVNGYVKRHLAQRPSGDIHDTAWRYSLMNWGHDPAKT